MMQSNKTGIPILYYHSIADHSKPNEWSFLSLNKKVFERQINYLINNSYNTCNWEELYNHIHGNKELPEKTVMFHFDDGFLDNWSVVFPIMEKAGLKYSVLLTPEFIQEGDIRPFVKDTRESNKSNWWGYLNKKEIRKMSESGLVDFVAHGYTHTWFESSDKLIDVYDGNNFYPHLAWNLYPEKKPYWLTEKFTAPIGFPVFEYKKSLELERKFNLNREFINEVICKYSYDKTKQENMNNANIILEEYKKSNKLGSYETDEEKHIRLKRELLETKEILEQIIEKPINYVVFPGGGNSNEVLELCKGYSYKLVSKGVEGNSFNSKTYQIERFSGTYSFPFLNSFLNLIFLRLQLMRTRENKIVILFFKLLRG